MDLEFLKPFKDMNFYDSLPLLAQSNPKMKPWHLENIAASTLRCLAPKPLFLLKTVFLEEKKTFSNKSEKDITSISLLAGKSQNNQFLIEFAYGRLCSISRMFLQL